MDHDLTLIRFDQLFKSLLLSCFCPPEQLALLIHTDIFHKFTLRQMIDSRTFFKPCPALSCSGPSLESSLHRDAPASLKWNWLALSKEYASSQGYRRPVWFWGPGWRKNGPANPAGCGWERDSIDLQN